MAEFQCDYCSAIPRHGCESRAEAARCANQSDPGSLLDFDRREVAAWLRSEAESETGIDAEIMEAAAKILDN
jgi:hypothetical protein